ncbi:unnamed protein product, partial [Strongylus vulgaris]
MPELKNIYPVFAIRKSDGYLLGGVAVVVTDIIFGPFYVMRPEARALGVGMKMMGPLIKAMAEPIKTRTLLGRAVKSMLKKYSAAPFYAVYRHEMYAFTLPKEELLNMFPCSTNPLVAKSFKEMSPDQFEKVCDYDRLVSGRDRREFLKAYHSLFFTKGIALLDATGEVKGIAGATPTLHSPKLIKIGPVFTSTREDASYLIKSIVNTYQEPDIKFVLH